MAQTHGMRACKPNRDHRLGFQLLNALKRTAGVIIKVIKPILLHLSLSFAFFQGAICSPKTPIHLYNTTKMLSCQLLLRNLPFYWKYIEVETAKINILIFLKIFFILLLTIQFYCGIIYESRKAPLAQLVEQLTLNQWVPGSNP